MNAMMRVRLKADGRIVEILADGTERAIAGGDASHPGQSAGQGRDAVYAKGIRARAKLTQAEFAARIGVRSRPCAIGSRASARRAALRARS